MGQNHPAVQEDMLIYQLDGRTQMITLDTSEWYTWLVTASTFTFRSPFGTFTAGKERAGNNRGGWHWKAYRRRGGNLLSAYLGKLGSLNIERLHSVAGQLTIDDC